MHDYLKGLNDRSPWLAFMMLVLMMSTAGIPFLVGFYAKFAVLQAVVAQGFVGLAIFAVILSVIGAFYYLRVVKVMYFDKAEDDTTLSVSADAQVLMGANGLAVMLLGVYPSGLMALCSAAIH